jgi:dipeptidase E
VAPARHIVGLGGGGDSPEQTERLNRFVLDLVGKQRPKLLFVPTASADADSYIVGMHELFDAAADVTHLKTFPWPPADLRDLVLSQDVIYVGGGNTANMLAIWRVHGIDALMREAWEQGIVLTGVSAGMICWFEHGVTDSFGPELDAMECLGFLPGSACPHYDGEEQRRPRCRALVDEGLPAVLAADDGVGLHFTGTDLTEVVSCRPGAAAYRVTPSGEERLETRQL